MDMADSCRGEVRRLHEFFVEWFSDGPALVDFARVEDALHPDFSMVLPSGETIDRTTLQQIRAARASATGTGGVGIEIVDHTTLAAGDDAALVSYQERQLSGDVLQNARSSTAYFIRAPHAPHGVRWLRLHETLLSPR